MAEWLDDILTISSTAQILSQLKHQMIRWISHQYLTPTQQNSHPQLLRHLHLLYVDPPEFQYHQNAVVKKIRTLQPKGEGV